MRGEAVSGSSSGGGRVAGIVFSPAPPAFLPIVTGERERETPFCRAGRGNTQLQAGLIIQSRAERAESAATRDSLWQLGTGQVF